MKCVHEWIFCNFESCANENVWRLCKFINYILQTRKFPIAKLGSKIAALPLWLTTRHVAQPLIILTRSEREAGKNGNADPRHFDSPWNESGVTEGGKPRPSSPLIDSCQASQSESFTSTKVDIAALAAFSNADLLPFTTHSLSLSCI